MIICPNCGELTKEQIHVFNKNIRKQDFGLLPVLPTCRSCNSEVEIQHFCWEGNIIILNGTCGSGKSTIAEYMIKKGFKAIDGDCAMQAIKHKRNVKTVNFRDTEVIEEIAYDIDILSLYSRNLVLAAIIMPEDLDKYITMLESRNLNYRFVLLKPDYQTVLERCLSRTCHANVTPEYWIRYFYDLLVFDNRVDVLDNAGMTIEETAECILKLCIFRIK